MSATVSSAWPISGRASWKQEAGYYAFNDVHAMMSFAATGRAGEIARLRRAMRNAVEGRESNAAMTREVGMPLADGLEAFANNRYAEAIAAIEPVRDTANRFGGSHAQRDLLTLTLIDASIRAGRYAPGTALHRRAAGAQTNGVERAVAGALRARVPSS